MLQLYRAFHLRILKCFPNMWGARLTQFPKSRAATFSDNTKLHCNS